MQNDKPTNNVQNILDEFYDEEFVMNFFNQTSIATLRSMRARAKPGDHPPTQKFGIKVRYPKKLFHDWVANQPLRGVKIK
jgi:hypothetical protein